MKKLNRKLIKGTNWALAGLLAVCGISACSEVDEYGCPHADYEITGIVSDENNNPVGKAKVRAGHYWENESEKIFYATDSIITGADGKYNLGKLYETPNMIITSVEDGSFLNDTTKIDEFTEAERIKKSDGWYEGAFRKVLNIKLKKNE